MDNKQSNVQTDATIPQDYVPDINSIDCDSPQATSDEGSENLGTMVRDVYGQIDHIPLPARTTRSGHVYLSQVSLLKQTSHVCEDCDNDHPYDAMCDFLYDPQRQVHSALTATVSVQISKFRAPESN